MGYCVPTDPTIQQLRACDKAGQHLYLCCYISLIYCGVEVSNINTAVYLFI